MENSELLITALKKIGVYSIPVELLKYNLEDPATVNEIIGAILDGKVQTYPGLICFLEKKHNGKNVSVVQIPKSMAGTNNVNTDNNKNLNSNFQELSKELKAYFDNIVQSSADKLSRANKVFERRKTREEISKKVNERINEMFSKMDSTPNDEKSTNSVFQNISDGINNAFNTVSQEFNNAIKQSGEEKDTSFDSVMKDISNKVNNTVNNINNKINESINNSQSTKKTLDSIADDISEETKQFTNHNRTSNYSEYYHTKSNATNEFNKKFDDFTKGVEDTITDTFGKIGSFFENGIDTNKVSDTFSEVGKNIDNFFGSLFGNNSSPNNYSRPQNSQTNNQNINLGADKVNSKDFQNINTEKNDVDTQTNNIFKEDDVIDMESMFNNEEKVKEQKFVPEFISRVLEDKNVIGVSTIGKKHLKNNKNSEDWFEIANIGECTIVAMADGAGSKKFSGIAAKESCRVAVEYVKANVESIITNPNFIEDIKKSNTDIAFQTGCRALAVMIQNAVLEACNAIESEYKTKKIKEPTVSIDDFQSTFILTLVLPIKINNDTQHLVISCQIGDGAVATINKNCDFNNALRIIGENIPQKSYLMETKEKQYGNFMKNIKVNRRKISKLMIMTNGISNDYSPSQNEMLRLFLDLQINGAFNETLCIEPKEIVYIKKLMEDSNTSLEKLWQDRNSLNGNNLNGGKTYEKLLNWLEEYKCDDDRTFVIYDTKE